MNMSLISIIYCESRALNLVLVKNHHLYVPLSQVQEEEEKK